jgi:hypothetical protein
LISAGTDRAGRAACSVRTLKALERFQEKWMPLFRFENAANKDLERSF